MRLRETMIHSCEKPIFLVTRDRGLRHPSNVPELLEHPLLYVRLSDVVVATIMNRLLTVLKALAHVMNRLQNLVFHFYQPFRLSSCGLVDCSHASDQITSMANFLDCHCMLILRNREYPESVLRVIPRCNCNHPRQLKRFGAIYR